MPAVMHLCAGHNARGDDEQCKMDAAVAPNTSAVERNERPGCQNRPGTRSIDQIGNAKLEPAVNAKTAIDGHIAQLGLRAISPPAQHLKAAVRARDATPARAAARRSSAARSACSAASQPRRSPRHPPHRSCRASRTLAVARRHQPDLVAERAQFTRQMMCGCARLDPDQAWCARSCVGRSYCNSSLASLPSPAPSSVRACLG
jgi:hypothetical protein